MWKVGTLMNSWECKCKSHYVKQYGGASKLKIELPYDPAILLLDIYQKKMRTNNSKKNTHPCIYCGIIYNSRDTEATCVH